MRRLVGVVAVLALVVVSCGGGGSSGEAPAPADGGQSQGAGSPGSYETLREMQLDVEAAFILCNAPLKVYDPPEVEGAVGHADCKNDVGMFLFDPANVSAGAAAVQADAEGEVVLLVGDNWIVRCSKQTDCEKIQGIAGGELIGAS